MCTCTPPFEFESHKKHSDFNKLYLKNILISYSLKNLFQQLNKQFSFLQNIIQNEFLSHS